MNPFTVVPMFLIRVVSAHTRVIPGLVCGRHSSVYSCIQAGCHSIRPSGSEMFPGIEDPEVGAMEDVSTCEVTDFPGMDTILEDTTAVGESSSVFLLRLLPLSFFRF